MSETKRALRMRLAVLGVPYGLERSCKLVAGGVFGDRFLLSVHVRALRPDPLDRILAVLGSDVPAGLAPELKRALPGADVVHFGYEATSGAEICKVYFEHVATVRQAFRGSPDPGRP